MEDLKGKLEKIEKEFNTTELQQYARDLEIMAQYDKEDKIISSFEAEELAKEDRKIPSIQINIREIDNIIGGLRAGQLVVLSSPTGQGKTSFCQTLTSNFAKQNINTLWFSYEVGISEFMEKFEGNPLFYLPKTLKQNSIQWLEQRIIESIAKYDCKIVFIDHLHYLLEMQQMAEARSISLLIGMMVRELKKIAIKHGVIIFLIAHMRKLMYDKMPEIDDLRDSSFVGQEADVVMFLKRKFIGKGEEAVATNQTLLYIAKNRRTGNLGYVKLEMVGKQFVTLTKNYDTYQPYNIEKENTDRQGDFEYGV